MAERQEDSSHQHHVKNGQYPFLPLIAVLASQAQNVTISTIRQPNEIQFAFSLTHSIITQVCYFFPGVTIINIVVPMAGAGSRFSDAGYDLPKPLIDVCGKPMIEIVCRNLAPSCPHRFIFICQNQHLQDHGLGDLLQRIAPNCDVIGIDGVTDGAACTVLLARALIDNDQQLMIANCDQFIDIDIDDYLNAFDVTTSHGMVMTMTASDDKWSFVRLNDAGHVTELREKQPISDEATVGIYNFATGAEFVAAADAMISKNIRTNNEFYVAPVYNEMIAAGQLIDIFNIGAVGDGMYGLGTPADLDAFLQTDIAARLAKAS